MKRFWAVFMFLLAVFGLQCAPVFAEPSADQLRETIRTYIQTQEKMTGGFTIPDSQEKGKLRTLSLIRVHERVGKTGAYYYSCTDMKDVATGDELDLDFDVADTGKELRVVAVRIHKDNGKPRYTYDANDNLIPVSE
ncbi:MAG: hypothetical protein HYZ88_03380 [Candidatus Omnitrophica bacterium]|nr:hypothetical protein [Candidatus Omnitrophota bacterium]